MKTKNRTDKTSVVPAVTKEPAKATPAKAAAAPAKPPKFALEGNKWLVVIYCFLYDNKKRVFIVIIYYR
jgi:hypothetical protein